MALLDLLQDDFEPAARTRGKNFFDRGAVDIMRVTHRSLTASVLADQRYVVNIDWDGGFVEYECACQDYRNHQTPCPHIWATLLEAKDADRLPQPNPNAAASTAKAPWKRRLAEVRKVMSTNNPRPGEVWPEERELIYLIDRDLEADDPILRLELMTRTRRKGGQWDRFKTLRRLCRNQIGQMPNPLDRQILQMLVGVDVDYGYLDRGEDSIAPIYEFGAWAYDTVLKMICQSGRCFLRIDRDHEPRPLVWDDAGPWKFTVGLKTDAGAAHKIEGFLRRGDERMELADIDFAATGGIVFANDKAALLDDGSAFDLLVLLGNGEKLAAPAGQEAEMLAEFFALPRLPPIELPADLAIEQIRPAPRPRLRIRAPQAPSLGGGDMLHAELSFDYEGQVMQAGLGAAVAFLKDQQKLIHRDPIAEQAAQTRLHGLGCRSEYDFAVNRAGLRIHSRAVPKAVRVLAAAGWLIEADGKLYRNPRKIEISVTSSIDWFEVHGTVDFDGVSLSLPRLLAAVQKGENIVVLDDGAIGILPEEWLKKYGLLAALGETESDHLRFGKSQAGLLDALLATQPEATFDAAFGAAREALQNFESIQPQQPPAGFVGELRHYQMEGLGWMDFLRRFNFGGCLADDMGLGKTVQVLAVLESRRQARETNQGVTAPSLVIVPRSLIFNWKQEAERFCPKLRILDHTGPWRDRTTDQFGQFDLILTTYGTVRNDVPFLRDFRFDYLILDEAQAVKNSASESAKAVRLLNGEHRLALSGTPVQNHLGELWSLFEFLNPGMLGTSTLLSSASSARQIDPQTAQVLGKALRPFILRRTKDQVAPELPERLEQTLFCDFDAEGRKLYDELRDHYRQSLMTKIAQDGLNKSRIMILEALLRLRQAACHPGLVDKTRTAESSAKLEMILARLEECREEGHKALVFSQFTSLLAIVRKRLDDQQIPYEYLDGKTRDRQQRVERFQTDPACPIFLVSLKAGGLGLNLTAAEYVFLLDPWWNPSVEAQAIDRAHRIGQTRRVFAYRLITRDTVEQKVLDLQKTKRALADAIITADNRTLANLTREDLELLLS
jgi:superfamily II DNA or RNA helicase